MLPKVDFDTKSVSTLKLVINFNKTLIKQIQNNQKSMPAYKFKKCQEKNPRITTLFDPDLDHEYKKITKEN
jgi:hypothetical protein